MDKQPKLIDADKLLEWLGEIIKAHIMFGQNERVYAYKDVKKRIISGAFDPIPPTIKQGDKVKHPEYGEGWVKIIEGLDAWVSFDKLDYDLLLPIKQLEVSHD